MGFMVSDFNVYLGLESLHNIIFQFVNLKHLRLIVKGDSYNKMCFVINDVGRKLVHLI